MANSLGSAIVRGTLVSGTLDLLSAFVFGGMKGADPLKIMRGVASGPFGDGMRDGGTPAVLLGFATHFAIMTTMVSVYMVAASRIEWLRRNWLIAGTAYGFILYLIMYRIVLVIRYPTVFPKNGLWDVSNALFSHIICVGIPMAWIASKRLGRANFTIR